jgi:glycine cleavage system regulatory protein
MCEKYVTLSVLLSDVSVGTSTVCSSRTQNCCSLYVYCVNVVAIPRNGVVNMICQMFQNVCSLRPPYTVS